jgi:acyl-CoA synthetase (AMP-forming)/AMP-acid ligase II
MTSHEDEATSLSDTAVAEIYGKPLSDLDQQLWDIFAATASAHPDREALVSLWQPTDVNQSSGDPRPIARSECLRWSYGNLRDKAEHLANTLEKLGVGAGMHVAAVFWNCAEWGLFFWACAKIGATFIPIDPRVTDDFAFMLESTTPRVLVVQGADTVVHLTKENISLPNIILRIHCGSESLDDWIGLHELLTRDFSFQGEQCPCDTDDDQGPPRANGIHGSDGDTPALVVFTSGTTGKPKGCPHTNRNLVSQTNNYDPNVDTSFVDRWLVHTPVCHVFAINNALRAWRHGGTVVFAAKSFHIDATLTALVQEKCTVMSATPTLVKALLSHSSFPSPQDLNLSIVSISGTIIGPEHMRLCREGLGARDAIQAYGMSEGAPIISWWRQDKMLVDGYHPGVGKVLSGAAVRVCRQGSREVLSRMEVGELHISGPSVIHNYFGDVEDGEEKFYNDNSGRWLRTGDQAMIDKKGVVYILGRYNDLIIRGGENINPWKIESALSEIPGLLQVGFLKSVS